jgi:hypothetical protein
MAGYRIGEEQSAGYTGVCTTLTRSRPTRTVRSAADELDAFVFRFRVHDDATFRFIWHLDFGRPPRKTFRKQLMLGRL